MSKVYVFLADGFEEIEGLTVVDILRRAGADVRTVSISENMPVHGSHRIPVIADCKFADCDFADAELLVLPGGGVGTQNLGAHEELAKLLRMHHEKGTRLAAICAAPSVLGDLGLLQGKKALCYPGFEGRLTGAVIADAAVVTDGNITTSRGMGTAMDFALELVRVLYGEEKARELAASVIYGAWK